jgi:hypothetical protein
METILRKMSLIVVALVLLAAGIQTVELQARGEAHSNGGSHSMGGSRSGSRTSSRGRTQHANGARGNRRNNEARGQYGRHQEGRRDGRGNQNGYYNDSGEWIVPGAIGLGVGAAVLGSEECPEGTYFDELSGQCI